MAISSLIQWSRRSKWTLVIAGCWVEAVSGLSYVFSTYSPALKSQLFYNQSRIDTLAAAKDLGDHIGLAAGFLCTIWPNWAVLSLGSMLVLLGYGSLWLLTNHYIPSLPFWLVCIIMFLGTNGATFLDTSALVTCLPHVPSNRGPVVGLLKGFKGLSGAVFNQIYASFLAPDEVSFILLIALGPAAVMVPLIFLMGPGGTDIDAVSKVNSTNCKSDNITCSLLYAAASILAAYMLTVALLQDLCSISSTSINGVLTVVLLVILLLPLSVPRVAKTLVKKQKDSAACPLKKSLLASDDCEGKLNESPTDKLASMEAPQAFVSDDLTEDAKSDFLRPPPSDLSKNNSASALKVESTSAADYTLQKAFGSANFWLLFLSIFFSMGTGTTAFDNLSQMAEAQGYDNTQIFISMSNIWNFAGRLVGGYVSEISTRNYGHPRTLVLAMAQLSMAVGHILFAMASPGTIHIALFLVAMGYGAEWAVFPTALSELFGLQNFGVLYNFVNIASPTGSLIYSSFIAGPLYDWQARKQTGGTASDDGTPLACEGTICFGLTFAIMAGVCVTGAALSVALALRTRALYSKS